MTQVSYTGPPQGPASMSLGVAAPGSFAPALQGAGAGKNNSVQDNKAQATAPPRERRNSRKTSAGQNRENNLSAIQENAPAGKSLQDPHLMGTAPKDENEKNKLSESAVNLQHKLAR